MLRCIVAALPLALVGCEKPREPTPAPAALQNEAPPAVIAASAPIAEADLLALLARWTEVQNAGDFAGYEQLYASKFLGIKRAGDKTTRFARESWLADRKRMFAKPMSVEAVEPTVHAAAESAELVFTQRWASGTFRDAGPKKLLIVREGKQLRIAQEEMLRSELQTPSAKVVDIHFTLKLASGLYVFLPELPIPTEHGPITREAEEDSIYTHSAPVQAPDANVWSTQKVRLDDGCVGELDAFVLLSRVEPHFGTVQTWEGTGVPPGPAVPAKQIAEEAFALATPQVAARVRGCSEGLFAQRTDTPAPTQAVPVTDEPLLERARKAFAALPSVKALQQRHLAEAEDPHGEWWTSSLRAEAYRHPVSGQTLLVAQADNGGTCSDFSAQETAVFELRGDKLVRLRAGLPPARILRTLDVDGDGRLELLFDRPVLSIDRSLISPDKAWPEPSLTHSYQDCPC
ncbi:MAG TPA: hypothetical protein VFX59_19995 [Polyangiales bacterium]|nr:hypothetical protein [Polyangiales bacterium]